MSTTLSAPLELARAEFRDRLPGHFARMRWSEHQLREHQTARLREMLAIAVERSPFHAERLTGIDVETFELGDLSRLPAMTKGEMMASFDRVTTDRRLTRAMVDDHLAATGAEPAFLLDEYLALASGGSSGTRGVFVYRHDEAADYLAGVLRTGLARASGGGPTPSGVRVALVAAGAAIHATCACAAIADGAIGEVTLAPATLPLREIVARVQRTQPLLLAGYPSALARLAAEQLAGRLAISPLMVLSTSEQLTPGDSARIADAFGAPPANTFGSSEGLHGAAPPGAAEFVFASDLAILEFVDEDDEPVPVGTTADHVLVTNLFNTTQPLIRYRLDDRMTQCPMAAEHGHVVATVEGRAAEVVDVAGVAVHPLAFSSTLVRAAEVVEHQVRIDDASVTVDVVAADSIDLDAVSAALRRALATAGVPPTEVTVRVVDALERDPQSGKIRYIIRD